MDFGCCIKDIDLIETLHDIGYDYFEFSGARLADMSESEFDALLKKSRELNFRCSGLNNFCNGRPTIIGADFSEAEIEEYAEKLCLRLSSLGGRTIGIGAPKARILPEGTKVSEADEQCRTFLRITSAAAEKHGLKVLLEPVCREMCNYINTNDEALKIIASLPGQNIGMVLDFYHAKLVGENEKSILKCADLVTHTHISTCGENNYRGFPSETDKAEYTEIFRCLNKMHYDGTMSIEPSRFDINGATEALRMLRSAYRNSEV